MNVRLDEPVWLILAALIVPMSAAALAWLRAAGRARRWSAVVFRAVGFAMIVLALAGAALQKRSDRVAVVAVVDVSGSVQRLAGAGAGGDVMTRVRAALEAMPTRAERGPDDVYGVVVFDGRSAAIVSPTRSRVFTRSLEAPGADGTDIAAALRLAAAMIPPEAAGRLVLFSDGNQTSGDAMAAVAELAGVGGRRVPIDVVPVPFELTREVMVASVDAPPRAAAGATVNVRVTLRSASEAGGRLRLEKDGRPVILSDGTAERAVRLTPGENVVLLGVELDQARIHRFTAVFEPDEGEDTLSTNNRAASFTVTPGRGSVLVVDGNTRAGGAGSVIASTLERAGFSVSSVAGTGLQPDLLALQAYDLIVLENVPADAVPPEAQAVLAEYVKDLGGGLVMVGGTQSFGAGGWRGTPLEPILPVRLDLPEKLVSPDLAIAFVIDNSGSMRRGVMGSLRSQQQIANESTAAAVRSLDARDLISVIVFNSEATAVVPLTPNTDPDSIVDRVRRIAPGGGTNAASGLKLAREQLKGVDAKQKHVILLGDGRSMFPAQDLELAEQLAGDGVKVTTIAVGDEADTATMEGIAKLGGGAYYNVTNPHVLPRVFAKAVRIVRTPMVREEPFTPVVLPSGSLMAAGLESPPELGGLTITQPRPEPTIVNAMVSPQGEPVLAHWNVELGQVVAFTSDADRWAEKWRAWPGFARMWSQIVRQASRVPSPRQLEASARIVGDRMIVRLDASDDAGKPAEAMSVTGSVYAPDGERAEVVLTQVGPGQYEASVPAPKSGAYVAIVRASGGTMRAMAPVVTGATQTAGAEFRALKSDDALLVRIAEASGGRVVSMEAAATTAWFDRAGIEPRYAVIPVWPTLLVFGLALFVLDVATRRIAWDRYSADDFGEVRAGVGQAGALGEAVAKRAARVEPSIALDERDAENLRAAAKDRRRAERLAALRRDVPGPEGATVRAGAGESPEAESPLLAAKRRAREQLDTTGEG